LVREVSGSKPEHLDFSGLGKGVCVLDNGAGMRMGALAVYTPPGRACTAECCVCIVRASLTSKKQYLGIWREDWVFRGAESTVNNFKRTSSAIGKQQIR
jgi:hypothetical protein